MVPGDIYPKLMTTFSDFFAIPLTSIYNEITTTKIWPLCWKREYVTVIPKKKTPESLGDLRNISCTLLASKIYETYVLDWLKLQVWLRANQYGGVKGRGTDHVLVQVWQDMLENAEDYRAATLVTSIDYSKAFNRMSFQYCLEAVMLAKIANDSLGALEDKIDENEAALQRALEECEECMMDKFKDTIKDMVNDQLKAAGFDPDLSASAMTTIAAGQSLLFGRSYANITAAALEVAMISKQALLSNHPKANT